MEWTVLLAEDFETEFLALPKGSGSGRQVNR